MGSVRFPGKSMYLFNDRPSISYLIDSVLQVYDKSEIFIATSDRNEDDPIYNFCIKQNLNFFRGDNQNVASRYLQIALMQKPDFFIRLNADSPLLDHRIIVDLVDLYVDNTIDLVSTAIDKSFPSGMNAEAVNAQTFIREYKSFKHNDHFEHVTKYFYENENKFKILSLKSDIIEPQKYKFSFDTDDDRIRIENFFKVINKPHYEYTLAEKCQMYKILFL
jgi:spore coat polysaccharide biosynthesis protein SpsF (cytidylyltransferase family)